MKKYLLYISLLLLFFVLTCTGCGESSRNPDPAGDTASVSVFPSGQAYMPQFSGTEVLGDAPLTLDISNRAEGYFIAQASDTGLRYNVQMIDPSGVSYSYFIDSGCHAVIPFSGGDGSYSISVYEQIDGQQYAVLSFYQQEVTLHDPYRPFLYPNQYVNYSTEDTAIQYADTLLKDETDDLKCLDIIYQYITTEYTYDEEKAASVEAGYLPSIENTFETKKGICFDYAALMTAMLRSHGIPCKLQIGYSSNIKHAWIDVYIRSIGWVNGAIRFDGSNWSRLDPTYASVDQESDMITEYIGDGANYNLQFTR